MPTAKKDASKEITDYIKEMPEFSKAICTKLRSIILNADDSLAEEWKWGPHYASNGMVCGYGGFKQHVKLTFFNGDSMKDAKKLFNHCVDNEFSRSIKYVDVSEIDEKTLTAYIKESIAINKKGYKREVKNKEVETPADLEKALAKNKKAKTFYDALTYGYKKEFVEWVTTAKREETRNDRIAKTVAMCEEGRKLNDKYR
jgi:uncharacterized protein YdeI (YjbR/CyaY-like superfamily)